MRALSENRFAALSEVLPGDRGLIVHNRQEKQAVVKAVHADSQGRPVFQTEDGRVFDETRLLGQLGTVCTVDTRPGPDEIDFDPGQPGNHLDLPVAARLFGLTLSATKTGFSTPCPYCQAGTLKINRHKGMWLFGCGCGKKGDLMDFVGWLIAGDQWQPETMEYDQMAAIVLTAIHERIR